ncbi:40S ribosomal protein SA [Hordeum vulgare]|nr:40S ribosomal protein SA [Hordeum vulgare]
MYSHLGWSIHYGGPRSTVISSHYKSRLGFTGAADKSPRPLPLSPLAPPLTPVPSLLSFPVPPGHSSPRPTMAATAGEALRALSQKQQDIQVMLAADVYLGTKNCDFQME